MPRSMVLSWDRQYGTRWPRFLRHRQGAYPEHESKAGWFYTSGPGEGCRWPPPAMIFNAEANKAASDSVCLPHSGRPTELRERAETFDGSCPIPWALFGPRWEACISNWPWGFTRSYNAQSHGILMQ